MNCFDFVHFLALAIHKVTLYSGGSRNFERGCYKLNKKKLKPAFECSRKVQLAMHKLLIVHHCTFHAFLAMLSGIVLLNTAHQSNSSIRWHNIMLDCLKTSGYMHFQ